MSVPEALPASMAGRAFQNVLIYFGAILSDEPVALDLLLLFTIVRPVARLSGMADQISLGNLDMPQLPVSGRDEISVLASSFNRMRRSPGKRPKDAGGQ
jgi:HAMP domain-containing protein